MKTEQVIAKVAGLILGGNVLMTKTHSVGPYKEATSDDIRYVCFDLQGNVIASMETTPHAKSRYEVNEEVSQDFSPFGAAMAFISKVGVNAALKSIKRF